MVQGTETCLCTEVSNQNLGEKSGTGLHHIKELAVMSTVSSKSCTSTYHKDYN